MIVLGVDLDNPKLKAIPKTTAKIIIIKRITTNVKITVLSLNEKGALESY